MKSNLVLLAILVLIVSLGTVQAQKKSTDLKKEKFLINNDIGYAEAVKAGNTIYVSGAVGWGTTQEAIKIVYDQLGKILEHYHATFENVVKENLYALSLDSVKSHMELRRAYYKNDFPAATWIEVKRLYDPGLVLEVEIIAVLPDNK